MLRAAGREAGNMLVVQTQRRQEERHSLADTCEGRALPESASPRQRKEQPGGSGAARNSTVYFEICASEEEPSGKRQKGMGLENKVSRSETKAGHKGR